jgi:hypothetical protein
VPDAEKEAMTNHPSNHQQRLVNELLLRLKARDHYFRSVGESEEARHQAEEQLENQLLNARALPEYQVLAGRILDCVAELNKYLEFDDQFRVSVYLNCTSVRFRNRVLVMEFKHVPFNENQINHSLDVIFQSTPSNFGNVGRTTLVLARNEGEFVWRQSQPVVHAPAATSKDLAASLLRWLEDGTGVF